MGDLLTQLFSTRPLDYPPHLGWQGHFGLVLSLPLLFWAARNRKGEKAVKNLFILIMLALYGFFFLRDFSWKTSLPFYHCRLAMFFLLLSPDGSKLKQFWAYVGVLGPVVALVYPILYPYPFFHITNLSFVLLHQFLFYLSVSYLSHQPEHVWLTKRDLGFYSFVVTLAMAVVAVLTGGNYGFLLNLPILESRSIWFNLFLLTVLLLLSLIGVQEALLSLKERKEVGEQLA